MHAIDPPLLLDLEVALEVQKQVGGRHGAAGEEVLGHPAAVEVVGSGLVREDVHEEFAAWDEGLVCSVVWISSCGWIDARLPRLRKHDALRAKVDSPIISTLTTRSNASCSNS